MPGPRQVRRLSVWWRHQGGARQVSRSDSGGNLPRPAGWILFGIASGLRNRLRMSCLQQPCSLPVANFGKTRLCADSDVSALTDWLSALEAGPALQPRAEPC